MANNYLSMTPVVAYNQKTWTLSVWIKRGTLNTTQTIFSGGTTSGSALSFGFNSSNQLQVCLFAGGTSTTPVVTTTNSFTDTKSWHHTTLQVDTTGNSFGSPYVVINYDGFAQAVTVGTGLGLNNNYGVSSNALHTIGQQSFGNANQLSGEINEVIFTDGSVISPLNFGFFNYLRNNKYQPQQFLGPYGVGGYYLTMRGQAYSVAFNASSGAYQSTITATATLSFATTSTLTLMVPYTSTISGVPNGKLTFTFAANSSSATTTLPLTGATGYGGVITANPMVTSGYINTGFAQLTYAMAGNKYDVNYLLVGGGGAGNASNIPNGGGGGGGVVNTGATTLNVSQSYAITVGDGGTGGTQSGGTFTNGGQSALGAIATAAGGGADGSSGSFTKGSSIFAGGGQNSGGGASSRANGGNAGSGTGGAGADGTLWSIDNNRYGGGGGGRGGGNPWTAGAAGAGGGGAGSSNSGGSGVGTAGQANTGGGGGDGGTSANGGSGVVIITYQNATQLGSGGTVTSSGSGATTRWFHQFNSSGTYTG